jgi:hypothetical protein
MKHYVTKSLISGHKIHQKFTGKMMLAINANKVDSECIEITVKNTNEKLIIIPQINKPSYSLSFQDKFGRGEYLLLYYNSDELKDKQLPLI